MDGVLESITREALLLLDCRLSAFFLYDSEKDYLRLHSLQNENGLLTYEENLKPADSILGTALRGFRQVQTRDLLRTEEHHFVSLIRQENLHSMLVTPVVYEDEAIGLLSLYVDRKHRFNDDERLIVRALADLGAIAVQNARLYGRVFSRGKHERVSLTTLGTCTEIAHDFAIANGSKTTFDSLELDKESDESKNKDLSIIQEKLNHLDMQIAGRF